jgi:hypothetical protein
MAIDLTSPSPQRPSVAPSRAVDGLHDGGEKAKAASSSVIRALEEEEFLSDSQDSLGPQPATRQIESRPWGLAPALTGRAGSIVLALDSSSSHSYGNAADGVGGSGQGGCSGAGRTTSRDGCGSSGPLAAHSSRARACGGPGVDQATRPDVFSGSSDSVVVLDDAPLSVPAVGWRADTGGDKHGEGGGGGSGAVAALRRSSTVTISNTGCGRPPLAPLACRGGPDSSDRMVPALPVRPVPARYVCPFPPARVVFWLVDRGVGGGSVMRSIGQRGAPMSNSICSCTFG